MIFFFFWHLLLHSHYYIYTRLAQLGGPAASLTALELVSLTAPHTCSRTTFRASSSMYNSPAKCTPATRGMTHAKTRRRLRHDYVTTLQQPLGTNGFFKFHRYVLQPQIQRFIHNDSQFLLKLGWWRWCCCQCSPMYIM